MARKRRSPGKAKKVFLKNVPKDKQLWMLADGSFRCGKHGGEEASRKEFKSRKLGA